REARRRVVRLQQSSERPTLATRRRPKSQLLHRTSHDKSLAHAASRRRPSKVDRRESTNRRESFPARTRCESSFPGRRRMSDQRQVAARDETFFRPRRHSNESPRVHGTVLGRLWELDDRVRNRLARGRRPEIRGHLLRRVLWPQRTQGNSDYSLSATSPASSGFMVGRPWLSRIKISMRRSA